MTLAITEHKLKPESQLTLANDSTDMNMHGPEEIILAEPRGFCAGVDRAIEIVEKALQKFGSPI
jgi:hypothetical protein